MANINKTILKNIFKDNGIERVSGQVMDNMIEDMLNRVGLVAKEAKIILDEDNKKTLSVDIFNLAVDNIQDNCGGCGCND